MAVEIKMPKLSATMQTGVIQKWRKKEGERVEYGEVIADIETDKAVMELEAFDPGVMRKIIVPEGSKAPVNETIAIIGDAGEDVSSLSSSAAAKAPSAPAAAAQPSAPAAPRNAKAAAAPTAAPPPPAPTVGDAVPISTPTVTAMHPTLPPPELELRTIASPAVRKIARERGIDLRNLRGTGPQGRIVLRDVVTAPVGLGPGAPYGPAAPVGPEYEDFPLTPMRETIARRMSQSAQTVPHFYLVREIDMDGAMALREELNALGHEPKISVNDLVVKACAYALERVPRVNSSFQGDKTRVYKRIDIGVAVSIEDGLLTPVIRHVSSKTIAQIATEGRLLAERARHKKLKPEEYTGGTFTVSNLGMYSIDQFSAVINPPEGAILAVGTVQKKPVVKGDQVVVAQRMRVTLSCDHRVVDGALGAQFLQALAEALERPARLLM